MLYTPSEYCKIFRIKGKLVSAMTIRRRCKAGFLPKGHKAVMLWGVPGQWIIEVKDNK